MAGNLLLKNGSVKVLFFNSLEYFVLKIRHIAKAQTLLDNPMQKNGNYTIDSLKSIVFIGFKDTCNIRTDLLSLVIYADNTIYIRVATIFLFQ